MFSFWKYNKKKHKKNRGLIVKQSHQVPVNKVTTKFCKTLQKYVTLVNVGVHMSDKIKFTLMLLSAFWFSKPSTVLNRFLSFSLSHYLSFIWRWETMCMCVCDVNRCFNNLCFNPIEFSQLVHYMNTKFSKQLTENTKLKNMFTKYNNFLHPVWTYTDFCGVYIESVNIYRYSHYLSFPM